MAPNQPMAPQSPQTPQATEGAHVSQPVTPVASPAPAVAATAQAPAQPAAAHGFVLPSSVVTRSDLSRALRELQSLNDYFHQAALRSSSVQELPTTSRVLDSLATENQLNLLNAEHRSRLSDFLKTLKAKAPVVHMSFPSEASAPFLARILEWFRHETHPYVVLHVGLQPELAAGCLVRTTNKQFDFSFRKRFEQSKQKLLTAIEALDDAPERITIADANATVAVENRLAPEGADVAPAEPEAPATGEVAA